MLVHSVIGTDMEDISLVPKPHPPKKGKGLCNSAGMRLGGTYHYTVMSLCLECSGACNTDLVSKLACRYYNNVIIASPYVRYMVECTPIKVLQLPYWPMIPSHHWPTHDYPHPSGSWQFT